MNRMTVTIRFLGAAGTVTGSKYLVEHDGQSLLVDCGLFQGYKQLRLRNREPLPVLPNRIGAMLLTHAHLDHTGYLPLLCRECFRGKVWSTPATSDLAHILYPDSGHIQEADADFANRHGFSKHSPALPFTPKTTPCAASGSFAPVPTGRHSSRCPGGAPSSPAPVTFWGPPACCSTWAGGAFCSPATWAEPDDVLMWPPEPPPASPTPW
ncbi:MAG: MBL fold metallo-hydrolase [Burkholderiaceae bacterium]